MNENEIKASKELMESHADLLGREIFEVIKKYGLENRKTDQFIHDHYPIVVVFALSAVLENVASMLYPTRDGQDTFLNCVSTRINQIRSCPTPGDEVH